LAVESPPGQRLKTGPDEIHRTAQGFAARPTGLAKGGTPLYKFARPLPGLNARCLPGHCSRGVSAGDRCAPSAQLLESPLMHHNPL